MFKQVLHMSLISLLLTTFHINSNGGVLPYAQRNGQYYFLFGKEERGFFKHLSYFVRGLGWDVHFSPSYWSDFGGLTDAGETNEQTALRECSEETRGVFGGGNIQKSIEYLKERYTGRHTVSKNGRYQLLFIEVDFIDSFVFKSAPGEIEGEKFAFAWVRAEDLLYEIEQHCKNPKRPMLINGEPMWPVLQDELELAEGFIASLI